MYLASGKFLKLFSAKRLKNQTKTNNKKSTQATKNSVHSNPVSGWKILHHLTNAKDAEFKNASKQEELLTQHMKSLQRLEEILAQLHWEAERAPVAFWLLGVGK